VLEFTDTAALLAFLDSTGSRASLTQENGKNLLRLELLALDAAAPYSAMNADLVSLLREVSAGYEIGISLSAPKTATLAVIPPSVMAARVVPQGKTVSFAIGVAELLDLGSGLALEIRW
jgi:hypothetical protein